MSDLERERREIAAALQQPGVSPDPSLRLTRRIFLHKSCILGAATVGQTFGWWPLLNTIDVAYAAEEPFKFAWISDTHLYPRPSIRASLTRRHGQRKKCRRCSRRPTSWSSAATSPSLAGGRTRTWQPDPAGSQDPQVFIPGEHDWYFDMGAKWRQLYGEPNWTFDHKGVRFIGLDTISRAPDYWTARKMTPEERMDHMADARRHRRRSMGWRRR